MSAESRRREAEARRRSRPMAEHPGPLLVVAAAVWGLAGYGAYELGKNHL